MTENNLPNNKISSWEEIDGYFLEAVKHGDIKDAEKLLGQGADVNAQDEDGWTALMFSAKSQNVEMAQMLMDNGADDEIRNKDGNRAIWIAQTGPVGKVIWDGLMKRINDKKTKQKAVRISDDKEM